MVLHIANDYNHSKVYMRLFEELDNQGLEQVVYIPMKIPSFIGRNHFSSKKCSFIYSKLVKKYHRYFFRNKINYLFNDLTSKINVKDVKIIHATTLYSDGFVAYKIYKKYNIPYIVAVRNTDIYTFYRYRKDLLFSVNRVLKNARKVVFISDSNMKEFQRLRYIRHRSYIDKYLVVNNGIDALWLNNRKEYRKAVRPELRCIFVGRFDKNKNVLLLIDAIKQVRNEGYNVKLTLVGGKGIYHEDVINIVKSEEWVAYLGYLDDKNKLLEIYRDNDFFTLVSHHETFGLVYCEALSQGLPILYTKNQGFFGTNMFAVGEAVDSRDVIDVASKLKLLFEKEYADINSFNFNHLDWRDIASKYVSMYEQN